MRAVTASLSPRPLLAPPQDKGLRWPLERAQIRAMGLLKAAAAQVNQDLGLLAPEKAAAIIAASFITGGTEEALSDTFVPPTYKVPAQSFLSGYANVANIIFAFQGQSEFYEMAAEMKNPKKFPFSLGLSQCIMLTW